MTTRILPVPSSMGELGYLIPRLNRPRIIPSEICLSRVKRCLFGPRSAEEAFHQTQMASIELQRQTEMDSNRWNFNFLTEQPQDGRLIWFPVSTSSREETASKQNSNSTATHNSSSCSSNLQQPQLIRCDIHHQPVSQRLRQSQITDYWTPRKRAATTNGKTSVKGKRLRLQCEHTNRRT